MPDTALAEALRASVAEVLEKMFFVRSLDDFEDAARECVLVAHLTFEGEPSGSLTLRVAAQAARSIAADFLGMDEGELADAEVGEVICELANMICGSVLSRVESESTFRLATPRIVEPESAARLAKGAASGGDEAHEVEISRGFMKVSIQTEAPACHSVAEYAS